MLLKYKFVIYNKDIGLKNIGKALFYSLLYELKIIYYNEFFTTKKKLLYNVIKHNKYLKLKNIGYINSF